MAADPPIHIYRAPWVLPVSAAPVADGAVAVTAGLIVAVDRFDALQVNYPQADVTWHQGAALTPALVNAHIHLELSHLADLSTTPFNGSFTSWISRLLQLRDAAGATGAHVDQAALAVLDRQQASGVSALADIGNTLLGHRLHEHCRGLLLPFKEYLGLAESRLKTIMARLNAECPDVRCTGHAPYSTHARLLQRLKERARDLGHVFPVHVAEPPAEAALVREGRGEIVDFFEQRGFWDGSFRPLGSGSKGSIHYLHQLGLLDEQTLCVHSIHVTGEEIGILAGQGSKVCLCPGSNRFLGVGTAPLMRFLEMGLLPAIGTDSAASNPELSLWREMAILAEEHPEVDPALLFAMATRGGAEALGLADSLGTLEPGKKADMLAVPLPVEATTSALVHHHLATVGSTLQPLRVGW